MLASKFVRVRTRYSRGLAGSTVKIAACRMSCCIALLSLTLTAAVFPQRKIDDATFSSIRDEHLNNKITIRVEPDLVSGGSLLPWRIAALSDVSPTLYNVSNRFLSVGYSGQDATVIAVQRRNDALDIVARFADGTLAITSGASSGFPRYDRAFTTDAMLAAEKESDCGR